MVLACSLWTACASRTAGAQPDPSKSGAAPAPRILRAPRNSVAPIALDGRLDDAAWKDASPATGFLQREPDPGVASVERTEAFVVFDDQAIYVGMRMHEAHGDSVRAQLTRRDGAAAASDWASVMIDSYHDGRTAFKFSTTPYGVRHDVMLSEDTRADTTWDAVWQVATATDGEGWTAEFRIPLSQLRFSATRGDGPTAWGVQFMREVAHRSEVSYWAPVLPTDGRFVSLFGELDGPPNLAPKRRVELLPYTVGRLERAPGSAANPFYAANATSTSIGADARIGLTSNMTLTATINPDFGQVEADPSVVNLGAFESYFPERRPFFTEGAEIFRFYLVSEGYVFYSRRVGRTPQLSPSAPPGGYVDRPSTARINGALKLSGKTANGWSVGLLGALTEEATARFADSLGARSSRPVEPRTSYLVGRVVRDFRRGQSGIGAMATATNRRLDDPRLAGLRGDAYVTGVNGWHRFGGGRYEVTALVLGSQVSGSTAAITALQRNNVHRFQRPDAAHLTFDSTRTSLGGTAGEFYVRKIGGGHWVGHMSGGFRTPGVEINDVGYQTYADIWYLYGRASYRQFRPGPHLQNWSATTTFVPAWTFGRELERFNVTETLAAQFRNFWNASLTIDRWQDAVSTVELRGGPSLRTPGFTMGELRLSTDLRRPRSAEFLVHAEYAEESALRTLTVRQTVSAAPLPQLVVSLAPTATWNRNPAQYLRTVTAGGPHYLMGALQQRTVALILRTSYALTADLAFDLYLQPFLSAGTYRTIKEVADPKAAKFRDRFTAFAPDQIALDAATNRYSVDADRNGTPEFSFPSPDFSVRELRSNMVLRWEFRPGSTLYAVWSQARDDGTLQPGLELGRDGGRLFTAPARDVFLLKVSYWIGR